MIMPNVRTKYKDCILEIKKYDDLWFLSIKFDGIYFYNEPFVAFDYDYIISIAKRYIDNKKQFVGF
ncbi:MAG: hypothetical protein ACOCZ5_01910 [bacterium]